MSLSCEERKAEFRELWAAFARPGERVMETDARVADAVCCLSSTVRIWRSVSPSAPSERVLKLLRRELTRLGNKKK